MRYSFIALALLGISSCGSNDPTQAIAKVTEPQTNPTPRPTTSPTPLVPAANILTVWNGIAAGLGYGAGNAANGSVCPGDGGVVSFSMDLSALTNTGSAQNISASGQIDIGDCKFSTGVAGSPSAGSISLSFSGFINSNYTAEDGAFCCAIIGVYAYTAISSTQLAIGGCNGAVGPCVWTQN